MIASTLFSLILPALVSAHGYVYKVSIDGTVYQGNSVGTTATVKSAIRQVNSNEPVKGATNPDITCGPGSQPAALAANANPGSTVQVYWVGGTTGSSPWPHDTGPVMHYMAQCQGDCSTYNPSSAEWFKISELGQQNGTSTWYQAQIKSGGPVTFTIPSTLAAGNYMLRSEIITLQLAMTQGGAEFYPSCIQLSVGGSQTGQPTTSEEVKFPGAYSDTDPGIYTPNVYNPGFTYTFPGPPVVNLASNGSSGGSTPSSAPTAPSPSPSAASPSSMPSSSPSSTPSMPGGYPPPASATSSTPYPTPTGGSSSCMRKRSPEAHVLVVDKKRMHRRRNRSAH
ncbi:glycosyl hydrolase family 61-domain-containing protein [Boletus reticuloceps]|uniref:lytic cellulose monooxygenase (C4-dehydrogenating) n=1 Tax=Boletus reticuloceps TaxID=495285 RepID=A0A8I3A5J7_9AGAM|nr:glycosyl hydrolase family 61-domain-containing protein [Boletus reticuloceps]